MSPQEKYLPVSRKGICVLLISICLLAGCVAPLSRTNPLASIRSVEIKRVVILPPKVDVYEIGAGGVREKIDEWSEKATDNITRAAVANLSDRFSLQAAKFPSSELPANILAVLTETDLLFNAVNRSLLLHSYGPPNHYFDDHVFTLSLGKEIGQLNMADVDAFLILRGSDNISSAGRKTLQGATMIAAAALGVVIIPQAGMATLSVALVDAKDGAILWHGLHRGSGGIDLRELSSAHAMMRGVLTSFPVP
jgi:hypothetical protein